MFLFSAPLFRLQGDCPTTLLGAGELPAATPAISYALKTPTGAAAAAAAATGAASSSTRSRAARPLGTGGAARAKPAPVPCRLPAARPLACPPSARPVRGGRVAESGVFATGRIAGGARSVQPAMPAPAELRAQDNEFLRSSAAQLRVCGPLAALGDPEHCPVCISGSRLWMPRPRDWRDEGGIATHVAAWHRRRPGRAICDRRRALPVR